MDFLELGMEVTAIYKSNGIDTFVEGVVTNLPSAYPHKAIIKAKKSIEVEVLRDNIVMVNGYSRVRPTYYQPRLTEEEWEAEELDSHQVYRDLRNLIADYPERGVFIMEGGEVEDFECVDDEEGITQTYYVDVPNPKYPSQEDEFTNVYTTNHKPDAILYAQLFYNADENGRVSLISGS
jgi:hypothetical protein